jgi:hypothetical protein
MRFAYLMVLSIGLVGCGNNNSNADMSSMCKGGPASGAQDMHCVSDAGLMLIAAKQSQCTAPPANTGGPDYGDTMYNASGYDDDCKYFVSYSVDPVCANRPVNFTVTLKDALMMKPVTGAGSNGNMIRVEAFLDPTHPASVAGVKTSETSPGVYTFGPVTFPSSGMWTVRFHFFENCTDLPDSPHGHAAFYVNVP